MFFLHILTLSSFLFVQLTNTCSCVSQKGARTEPRSLEWENNTLFLHIHQFESQTQWQPRHWHDHSCSHKIQSKLFTHTYIRQQSWYA